MPNELTWTGAIDDVFATAGNWIDEATSAASLNAPANTDTLTVNYGNRDIAAAVTGLTSVIMSVGPEYNGTIAPGGTLDINLTSLRHYGKKGNYGGTIAYAEIDTRSKVNFNPSGAETITSLVTNNTPVDIGANCVVTKGYFGGRADVNIAAGTAMTLMEVFGGAMVNTLRNAVVDIGANGTVVTEGTATLVTGSVIQSAGTLFYNSGADFPGSCITRVKAGGRVDFSGSRRIFAAETFTLARGAIANFYTSVGKATVTENFLGRPFGGPAAPAIPL